MTSNRRKFSLSSWLSGDSNDSNTESSHRSEDNDWSRGKGGSERNGEGDRSHGNGQSASAPVPQTSSSGPQPQSNAVAVASPALPDGWTRLDDASAYISYSGGHWTMDHPDDTAASKYLHGTFHASTLSSSWVQFAWRGSDIIVYGAKRDNHGMYAIALDDYPVLYQTGLTIPGIFQTPLFKSENLRDGSHSILIVNENAYNATSGHATGLDFLDIDFVDFNGEALSTKTFANVSQQEQLKVAHSAIASTDIPPTTISQPKSSASTTVTKLAALSVSNGEAVITVTSTLPASGIPNSRPSGGATLGAERLDHSGLVFLLLLYIPVFWIFRR